MKKKVLAWMLSVFMVLTMMPLPAFAETGDQNSNQTQISQEEQSSEEIESISEGQEADEGLSGEGTVDSPYIIKGIDDLKWFRDDVNSGNDYSGKVIKLNDNIELEGEEWDPIGFMGKTFKGTFDGHNHTISYLVIT